MTRETQLIHFDQARRALAEAHSIDEVKVIRDQAQAMRAYIKQQKGSLEMQNQCAEIKIRAERRAGEMLRAQILNEGGRPPKNHLHDVSGFTHPTLEELGISAIQSYRWQLEAELPEDKVEQFIAETKAKSDELTSRAILNIALKIRHEERRKSNTGAVMPEGVFQVIVIDPPWPYGGDYNPNGHRVASPYQEISLDELAMLDLPAADDCILWLWATNKFMHEAYHLLDAWGFEPKTILTWFKGKIGTGYWLRGETEHCLLGTQGSPTITGGTQSTHLKAQAARHSAKPDEFYKLVESLCPGNKLDIFGRKEREGWIIYGDQRI